jgi:hypothetical protein
VDAQPVERGAVRFVPIEGTHGPLNTASIERGEYRVDARGGVPLGVYRVEVEALKPTGKKVQKRGRFGPVLEEEYQDVGSSTYAGAKSPLRLELTSESDDRFDIHLPIH